MSDRLSSTAGSAADRIGPEAGKLGWIPSFSLRLEREIADEWKFVLAVTGALLLLTSVPYVFGYLSAPHDKVFMGVLLDVPDHEQYFSWMRDLSSSWLASNRMTPEPNRAVFFNLLWFMLGRFGAWFHLGIAPMYQLLRGLSAFAFFASLSVLLRRLVPERSARRLTFGLIAVGSGFGWVLVLLKYTLTHGQLLFPLDVFIAEGNSFLDVMAYPHFVAAAVYILVFELVLRAWERKSTGRALAAGVLALFLGWQHAYDLILVYGILGAYVLALSWRDRSVPKPLITSLVILVAVSVWPAAYSVLLTRMDPVWKGVLDQFSNAGVYSPNPIHLVIVMGIPLLLALGGFFTNLPKAFAKTSDRSLFVRTWFVANMLLLYIPTDYQVHMLNGLQVPVSILAVEFVFVTIVPRVRGWWQRSRTSMLPFNAEVAMACGLLLLVLPTNVYLWTWRFVDLARADYPYYLHVDELNAIEWLDRSAGSEDVVLSSLTVGQFVPAYTDSRAFLSHWAQTLDFYTKNEMVDSFFSSATTDAWRINLLREYGIDYVLVGDAERSLGDFDPGLSSYLRPVYESGPVTIYRFQPQSETSSLSGARMP